MWGVVVFVGGDYEGVEGGDVWMVLCKKVVLYPVLVGGGDRGSVGDAARHGPVRPRQALRQVVEQRAGPNPQKVPSFQNSNSAQQVPGSANHRIFSFSSSPERGFQAETGRSCRVSRYNSQ